MEGRHSRWRERVEVWRERGEHTAGEAGRLPERGHRPLLGKVQLGSNHCWLVCSHAMA